MGQTRCLAEDRQRIGSETPARRGRGERIGQVLYSDLMEATPRIELGVEVLQTSALPLGYVAALRSRFYLRPQRPASRLGCGPVAGSRLSGCHGAPAGGGRPR